MGLLDGRGAVPAPCPALLPAVFVPVEVVRCVLDHFAAADAPVRARMMSRGNHLGGKHPPLPDASAQPRGVAQGQTSCADPNSLATAVVNVLEASLP